MLVYASLRPGILWPKTLYKITLKEFEVTMSIRIF